MKAFIFVPFFVPESGYYGLMFTTVSGHFQSTIAGPHSEARALADRFDALWHEYVLSALRGGLSVKTHLLPYKPGGNRLFIQVFPERSRLFSEARSVEPHVLDLIKHRFDMALTIASYRIIP